MQSFIFTIDFLFKTFKIPFNLGILYHSTSAGIFLSATTWLGMRSSVISYFSLKPPWNLSICNVYNNLQTSCPATILSSSNAFPTKQQE